MTHVLINLVALVLLAGCMSSVEETFDIQEIHESARFQAIDRADDGTLWISGSRGVVARQSEAGGSWDVFEVPGAGDLEFRDLMAVSRDEVTLVSAGTGAASQLWRTVDGGAHWSQEWVNPWEDGFYSGATRLSSGEQVVFSDGINGRLPLVVRPTHDAAWVAQDSLLNPMALPGEGAFAASGYCIVEGPAGEVIIATGAGPHPRLLVGSVGSDAWRASRIPIYDAGSASGAYAIAQAGEALWVAGGDYLAQDTVVSNLARTDDLGRTWQVEEPIPLEGAVFGLFAEGRYRVAVGPAGAVYSSLSGADWAPIDSTAWWSVGTDAAGAFILVGPQGKVGRWVRTP